MGWKRVFKTVSARKCQKQWCHFEWFNHFMIVGAKVTSFFITYQIAMKTGGEWIGGVPGMKWGGTRRFPLFQIQSLCGECFTLTQKLCFCNRKRADAEGTKLIVGLLTYVREGLVTCSLSGSHGSPSEDRSGMGCQWVHCKTVMWPEKPESTVL